MKKFYFIIALLILFTACKENSSTPAPTGRTGEYRLEIQTFVYDFNAGKFPDQPNGITKIKANASRSWRKFSSYSDSYGKNWNKGEIWEKMGSILEAIFTNFTWDRIVFTYDAGNYLKVTETKKGNINLDKIDYDHINGKINSITYYDSTGNMYHKEVYSYDASGYISKCEHYVGDNILAHTEYYSHNSEGYVTEIRTELSNISSTETFTYNNQGLVTSIESDYGARYMYSYNTSGQLIEEKYNSSYNDMIVTASYDSFGFPSVVITETWNKKEGTHEKIKEVYKYTN